MKVTYIKMFNKQKEENKNPLMKHLRTEEGTKEHYIKNKNLKIYNIDRNKQESKTKQSENNESKELLKKAFKKNQVALFAISLMLIASGYLNYTNNLNTKVASLGDAQLVSTNVVDDDIKISEIKDNTTKGEGSSQSNANQSITTSENVTTSSTTPKNEDEGTKETDSIESTALVANDETNNVIEANKNETVETAAKQTEYFTKLKLERDTMYSQMLETYQKILENNNIPNEQKTVAADEIKNINNRKNAITTIENLVKAKGINDIAVLINDNIVDAVVKSSDNLPQDQVAQITNIISRELKTDIENIHISEHS